MGDAVKRHVTALVTQLLYGRLLQIPQMQLTLALTTAHHRLCEKRAKPPRNTQEQLAKHVL